MADTKITALAAIATVDPAADVLPIVDISDTSMAASGTTKKVTSNQILGAGGTATLASATITGAATVGTTLGVTGNLTVDTNVLKVDTTNNRVGINTATPGYPLEVVGNAVFSADATCKRFFVNDTTGNGNVYINSANGSQSLINLGGQTNYNIGAIIYDDASNFLAFRTNSVEAARFNSTANLVLKGGTAAANGVGITFPATQVASSDANCLDDYEEGTFTPNIGGTATYTTNTGTYTKIGNRVYVSVRLDVLLAGTGEDFRISGLPFTSAGGQFALSVGYFATLKTNAAFLSAYVNGSQISMTGTTVSAASITNNIGVIGNGTDLMISGFYIV